MRSSQEVGGTDGFFRKIEIEKLKVTWVARKTDGY